MVDLFEHVEERLKSVSALTELEVRSAIRRRQASGEISESDAGLALEGVETEFRRLISHPITSTVIGEAVGLIDRQKLRSLDSVQLATALIAQQLLTENDVLCFVVSDLKLMSAALAEGLDCWNPQS